MSRSKSKQLAVPTTGIPAEASAGAVASSLPPTPDRVPAPSTIALTKRTPKPAWQIEKNSVVRKKAVAIIAMRAQGLSNDEIATELKIRPSSVTNYVWMATRSGFLLNKAGSFFTDPKDTVEFELSHKIVRNLNAALDDEPVIVASGEIKSVSRQMYDATMELAKGSLFKRFDPPKDGSTLPNMQQVLAIKIDMPTALESPLTIREGSIGGTPIYEGVVDESGQPD